MSDGFVQKEQKPFNTGRKETIMEETKQVGKGILYGLIAIFAYHAPDKFGGFTFIDRNLAGRIII